MKNSCLKATIADWSQGPEYQRIWAVGDFPAATFYHLLICGAGQRPKRKA